MNLTPKFSTCLFERSKDWVTIWFNRPEKRNALSANLIKDLQSALKTIYKDTTIRGIVFRGQGNVFCAGADLSEMKSIHASKANSRNLAMKMSERIGELLKAINRADQITVSVVHGAAMAGAFGFACATDFLLTTPSAKYSLSETKIGLTPAQIAPYVINKLGFNYAKKLMLLGSLFDGEKAYEIGMADFLSKSDNDLDDKLNQLKNSVNKCSPNAIKVTKKIINHHANTAINASELFADTIIHQEGIEGLDSFFQKRKPNWVKE